MLNCGTVDYFWTTWYDGDDPDDGNGDTENLVQVIILFILPYFIYIKCLGEITGVLTRFLVKLISQNIHRF